MPRKQANSAAQLIIPRTMENCGQYSASKAMAFHHFTNVFSYDNYIFVITKCASVAYMTNKICTSSIRPNKLKITKFR